MAVLVANPWAKALAAVALLTATAVAGGFFGFLVWIDRLRDRTPVRSDAIVVFTGEPRRIEVGVAHLAGGHARRMLISGTELSAGTETATVMTRSRATTPRSFHAASISIRTPGPHPKMRGMRRDGRAGTT